jgi:hypothetical protein
MKTRLPIYVCLIAFLTLATGCAFTKSTVQINYRPPVFANKVSIDKVITVEKLNDLRGGDPFLLSYKGVETKTSGTYVTDKEVADIITDSIKKTLTALNYKIADNQGDLVLSGDLLKLDSTPIMGFWSGDLDCTIQINLKLSDGKTGKLLWSDIFTGFNKETGLQVDSEEHRKVTTEAAIGDLMQKLAASAGFKSAVQNYAGQ